MSNASAGMNRLVAPSARVTVRGRDLSTAAKAGMLRVVVERELGLPASCSAVLDIRGLVGSDAGGVDLDAVAPGDPMTVALGVSARKTVFTGTVAAVEPTFAPEGSILEVRGFDALYKLHFGTKRRVFPLGADGTTTITDSDIARQVANDYGFTLHVDASEVAYSYVAQNEESDFDFLCRRAERLGFEIFVDGEEGKDFHFRKGASSAEAALTLRYGYELERFSVTMAMPKAGSSVELTGWDPKSKQPVSGKAPDAEIAAREGGPSPDGRVSGWAMAKKAFGDSGTTGADASISDIEGAKALAAASRGVRLGAFLEGVGEGPGDVGITPGITVKISGIGKKFGGAWYVTRVVHRVEISGAFTTKFHARRTDI